MVFARTLAPFTAADDHRIRNHLPKLWQVIVKDLRQTQTVAASIAKSHGQALAAARLTEADLHGHQRAEMGLTIVHLLAEYRALRSSVLRLWMEEHAPGSGDVDDIGRFNEAMDQAIAESVRAFALETENRRQLFLAALGHDLRNPLNAVALTAQAAPSASRRCWIPCSSSIWPAWEAA